MKIRLLFSIIGLITGLILGLGASAFYQDYLRRIHFDAHMLAASEAARRNNIEDAKFNYHVAISLDEQRYTPFLGLAMLYVAEGKPDAAKKLLQRALRNIELPEGIISGEISVRTVKADKDIILEEMAKLRTENDKGSASQKQ